jgi:hypothetical protein
MDPDRRSIGKGTPPGYIATEFPYFAFAGVCIYKITGVHLKATATLVEQKPEFTIYKLVVGSEEL